MPGTGSTAVIDTARRLRRRLRAIVPSSTPCAVPGCMAGRVQHDSCLFHSLTGQGHPAGEVPNDGIIDWIAIDVAVRGLRDVRLTWVEKDIATGVMLYKGVGVQAIQDRLGVRIVGYADSRRYQAAEKIAAALVTTSIPWEG